MFLLMVVVLLVGAGCEPNVTIDPQIDLGDPEVERKVDGLETEVARLRAEAAKHQTDAARLRADVSRLEEENVVHVTDAGFTFRINTQAAWVLAIAILGLTTFFVARMRYAAMAGSAQDDAPEL